MSYRLCVFDIDGVLNPAREPVQKEGIKAIKKLEKHGLKISFASGKHPWYITGGLVFSGLLRKDTVIVGEAGGHVFFPREKESILYTNHLKDIKRLRELFYNNKEFAHAFWEEPKETLFSVFPRKRENIPHVADTLERIIKEEKFNLYIITHVDAIDAMQNGLSKEVGLRVLSEHLRIPLEEMIAFGDGRNDAEMLSIAGYPVAVANAEGKIKKIVRERHGYISALEYGKGVLEAVNFIIENLL